MEEPTPSNTQQPVETPSAAEAQKAPPKPSRLTVLLQAKEPWAKKLMGWDDIRNRKIIFEAVAEYIGTLLFIFVACGSIVATNPIFASTGPDNGLPHAAKISQTLVIALTFGFTRATTAQALGHISGAHLNPAVSLGLIVAGHCSIMKAVVYVTSQCAGSLTAAVLLFIVTPYETRVAYGQGHTLPNGEMGVIGVLIIEFMIAFFLVLTVCGVVDNLTKENKGNSPLAIGLAITSCHLFAVQLSGSSMNPARSFGPAVTRLFDAGTVKLEAAKPFYSLWYYWSACNAGGIAAGFLYRFLFEEKQFRKLSGGNRTPPPSLE